jgi:hypothetical protein
MKIKKNQYRFIETMHSSYQKGGGGLGLGGTLISMMFDRMSPSF